MNSGSFDSGSLDSGSLGVLARWRLIPPGWRSVIVVVIAIVIAGVLIRLASAVTEGSAPQGPQSSSFSPTAEGLEAYSQLLGQSGARVEQITSPLSGQTFTAGTTLVVAAPTSWQPSSSKSLDKLLLQGGRVVLAGEPPTGLLETLLVGPMPTWSATPISMAESSGGSPLVSGIEKVVSSGPGSWLQTGETQTLLSGGGRYLALTQRVGKGTLVLLASVAPLQNRLIGQADNAAFGLDIGLSGEKAVAFDEYDHGFGQVGGGVGGLPRYWRAGLLLALAAVVLWLLSAVRRFGPPEDPERLLPPPRVAYVDALATLLSTTPPERAASATGSLQIRAREGLCRTIGLPRDASDAEIARAAATTGISDDLVTTVLGTPRTVDELVAVGRISADLSRERPS
jgi:hypothetical protein